ncbi:hypothetical protein [Deminuibacter soli]|uniref:hypothetical protein n=1 Tax=Deminuibacter soli TaxID=2291815 RepID=UPI001B86270E|nr:hypothetical protein [Deminuibacter soli]
MLSPHEEKFIQYWEKNRDRDKKLLRQLYIGAPVGLALGGAVLLSVSTGRWYERADMVANSQLNPNVLLLGVVIVAIFTGVFYKRYRWEMNEQQYQELQAKKRSGDKQQQKAAEPGSEQSSV